MTQKLEYHAGFGHAFGLAIHKAHESIVPARFTCRHSNVQQLMYETHQRCITILCKGQNYRSPNR